LKKCVYEKQIPLNPVLLSSLLQPKGYAVKVFRKRKYQLHPALTVCPLA